MLTISALNQVKATSFGSLQSKGTKGAKNVATQVADSAKKIAGDVFEKAGKKANEVPITQGMGGDFSKAVDSKGNQITGRLPRKSELFEKSPFDNR